MRIRAAALLAMICLVPGGAADHGHEAETWDDVCMRHQATSCRVGGIVLGDARITDPSGWNGARVLLVGCLDSLSQLQSDETAEVAAALSAFMERYQWGSFFEAKRREERIRAIQHCAAFRNRRVTDFLLFDPVSGHP